MDALHPKALCEGFRGSQMIEGPGFITRIDSYTLSVDGYRIRATKDQEARIRALTEEQRHQLLVILGKVWFEPALEQEVIEERNMNGEVVIHHVAVDPSPFGSPFGEVNVPRGALNITVSRNTNTI